MAYSVRDASAAGDVVFVQPFPATGAKSQVSANAEAGHHPGWSSDGKELFYNPGPGRPMTVVTVTTTRGFAFGAAPIDHPIVHGSGADPRSGRTIPRATASAFLA